MTDDYTPTLLELQAMAVDTTVSLGWRDTERSIGDEFALLHSEIAEGYEEYRDGHAMDEVYFRHDKKCLAYPVTSKTNKCALSDNPCIMKPEGVPTEIADEMIRLFDFADKFKIDLTAEILRKNAYNKTRGYRHGGKVV